MSAFNWIIFPTTCPSCQSSIELRCQTHIASSYDGDIRGRFHDKDYRLDEPMNWWERNNPDYGSWRVNGNLNAPAEGEVDWEACYSECPRCHIELFVVIEFHGPRAIGVRKIGFAKEWPSSFSK